ncbi:MULTISPECIES: copper resistance CopC family protein [unclassified Knoellia]|uniref:copper resistance CopC family protein n=1 Tax=Knoellia altitudinis TaxID=3404795 RepID=UPI003620F9A2
MRTTTRGLVLLLLTALSGLTLGALPASAHSRLISISPADGASVPASPQEIVLTFNEPINPQFVTVRVTDGEGGEVVGEKASTQGAKVTLPVGDPIAAGTYNVVYRVVSADSHPISGSTRFTVAGDPAAPPSSPSATPSESPSGSASGAATPSASTSPSLASPPAASEATGAAPASADTEDSGGTPLWVWFIVFVALVGAIAATFYAVRRDESQA